MYLRPPFFSRNMGPPICAPLFFLRKIGESLFEVSRWGNKVLAAGRAQDAREGLGDVAGRDLQIS